MTTLTHEEKDYTEAHVEALMKDMERRAHTPFKFPFTPQDVREIYKIPHGGLEVFVFELKDGRRFDPHGYQIPDKEWRSFFPDTPGTA